ncbi:MAG TPA: ferrous iron transporter B [Vicinamibacteria bacterium]|nr:ferrous iron transporter B [Vicinamibacteria bacterium]
MHDTLTAGGRAAPLSRRPRPRVVLIGNPNAGKTTLFNRLTGLRARTANFPGTTVERRLGTLPLPGGPADLEDLPGLYTLAAGGLEERIARDSLSGGAERRPSAAIVVLDGTNLARNLYLAGQARELDIPLLVVLNMMDLAEEEGLRIDADALSRELGAPVIALSARTGAGVEQVPVALGRILRSGRPLALPGDLAACSSCAGCGSHSARFDWAESVAAKVSRGSARLSAARTEQLDRFLTHPVAGLVAFAAVMSLVFVAIFVLAQYPMKLVEAGSSALGRAVGRTLPDGAFRSLAVDGVIGGVGGVLAFLPQICILFFFLSMLEDSGYLARAAFVMDRLMGKVGLPGKAFVPMLSAHACAIPAIMATRVIEGRRDRLATILVLPLMTCSARLPVYAMVTAVLFADRPVLGGLTFAGAYAAGITAALLTAWIFRRTILRGESRPLVLELPTYKTPSLANALLAMRDRGSVFLSKAGTVILLISLSMWAMATFPRMPSGHLARVARAGDGRTLAALDREAAEAARTGDAARAEDVGARIASLRAPYALEYSLAGRLGRAVEPVFRPLGFDWRMDVGVLTSFAARETLVSTLAVVFGVGGEPEGRTTLREALRTERRSDGSPLFGLATALPLLVFYVLAMQCLPTQAVTRKETGSWKWAALQLGYMTSLAYSAALVMRLALVSFGVS